MLQLLSVEWLKIKRYRTFWVLAGMFAVLLFLWNWCIGSGIIHLGSSDINLLKSSYTFPAVWPGIGHWTKVFSGLIALIIIILVTNEYQFRTNRQNVMDGWKRIQFFHAKWLLVFSLATVVTFYTFIMGLFFALYNGSTITDAGEGIIKLLHVFILTVNYFGFALTLALFLKRSGMAIIIFLLYGYIIEIMLQQLLNWKISCKPGDFLPMQCSAELLSFPLMKNIGRMADATGPADNTLVLVSICWVIAYYFAGRLMVLKSDW